MNMLTAFGLFAVTAMVVCYALEPRHRSFCAGLDHRRRFFFLSGSRLDWKCADTPFGADTPGWTVGTSQGSEPKARRRRFKLALTAILIILINLRPIVRALANRRLRAHPDRAPRQSAALWYERMLRRLARRGWRKSPGQTPHDFVAAIREPVLQNKVATFTRAYESARFGHSVEDARTLPELFEEITAAER